jgi:hypothetical protein
MPAIPHNYLAEQLRAANLCLELSASALGLHGSALTPYLKELAYSDGTYRGRD